MIYSVFNLFFVKLPYCSLSKAVSLDMVVNWEDCSDAKYLKPSYWQATSTQYGAQTIVVWLWTFLKFNELICIEIVQESMQ